MTLPRLLTILGVVFIAYAIVSGFQFHFSTNGFNSSYSSNYSIKGGLLIVGILLVYLSKRLRE